MNHFDALSAFDKEYRRLNRKFKTLDDDFKKLKGLLFEFPTGVGKNFVYLYSNNNLHIIKARVACQQLRNRSLRLVYAYFNQEQRIEFIELYFKGDKENEDRVRIKEYLKKHQN